MARVALVIDTGEKILGAFIAKRTWCLKKLFRSDYNEYALVQCRQTAALSLALFRRLLTWETTLGIGHPKVLWDTVDLS
jgi:hypothetical protein